MKIAPFLSRGFLPVACVAITACAAPRGITTYERAEVAGRPYFQESGRQIQILEGSRPTDPMIFWNDDVLDHRSMDTSRRYRFELLEGTVISMEGNEYKSSEVTRVYDNNQRLIYDASFCRVHALTMPRGQREGTIEAIRLPRGFDSAKARSFPNSKFDHPACNSSIYLSLDWTRPQCSEEETRWLEKRVKATAR